MVIQESSLDTDFVRDITGGPTTVFVGSIDHQPLATSERLIVFHLTNVLNKGMKFGEAGMYQIIDLGTSDKLVKRGSATITIPNQSNRAQVFAIDLNGKRTAVVPFEYNENNDIVFTAETIATDRPNNLIYEITR
ncbi:hypothetical protein SH580_17195 [Coraliomargarita algicola]|uniref:Uncharacterized protein n=1 Tax=Coraliomargarita algicola TaxID=3092156 RepID=A0ABZ0RG62_9BACT|nr:hypothetical protein [Coraliomargarita sp. J2-16]WPJ95160.1 hypothetical protein SH580_17195 [Coraliomargarita sp. J2-16]